MAEQLDLNWRDNAKLPRDCLHGLPNRPPGQLPEVRRSAEGSLWQICDFPGPVIGRDYHSEAVAKNVAWAFYTRRKFTREAFVQLLSSRDRENVAEATNPESMLRVLSATKYLGVYEGNDAYSVIPGDGVPSSRPNHVKPGFTRIWGETNIQYVTTLPYPVVQASLPQETTSRPPEVLDVLASPTQQILLLL